ncbi:hypothetical protein [Paenibacillus gansuensis]|uniref:LysM domain-containing protein n=1 Tax=Paenibacillus gansuensis TaxID=306542 RepID=A0ABW5PH83_9BACL
MNKNKTKWIAAKLLAAAALLALALPVSASGPASSETAPGTAAAPAQPTTDGVEHHHRDGKGWHRGFNEELLRALKTDEAGLKAQLKAGKSLAEIAQAKGVSRAELKDIMTRAFDQRLNQKKQRFYANLDRIIDAKGGMFGGGKRMMRFDFTAAGTVLGMQESEVHEALRAGKTLAELAKEKGIDPQKLIDAQVKDMSEKVNEKVKSGKLTQTEADQLKAKLTEHITDMVNNGGFLHTPRR